MVLLTNFCLLVSANIILADLCGDKSGEPSKECVAPPYTPGGNKVILEPIIPPTATLQETGVANMATNAGLVVNAASAGVEYGVVEGIFKNAAKLSASLSIWGAVFGFLGSQKPSAQDILDSVNKAFDELTTEINDQFENMKLYVEQEVLNAQRENWEDQFTKYYNEFNDCLKYHIESAEKVNSCMQDVEHESGSDKNTFMDFISPMSQSDYKPTPKDTRHMEVQFNVFRNYANLRIMILITLAATYRNMSTDMGNKYAKMYYQTLVSELDLYIKYANFIYEKILWSHNTGHDWVFFSTGTYSDKYDQWEGWPGVHTRTHMTAHYLMSKMVPTSEKCSLHVWYRADGKRPPKASCHIYEGSHGPYSSDWLFHIAHMELEQYYWDYNALMQKQIKNCWQPNIMERIPKWQEIHDATVNELAKPEWVNVDIESFVAEFKQQMGMTLEKRKEPVVTRKLARKTGATQTQKTEL